jgi:hypothetical protein
VLAGQASASPTRRDTSTESSPSLSLQQQVASPAPVLPSWPPWSSLGGQSVVAQAHLSPPVANGSRSETSNQFHSNSKVFARDASVFTVDQIDSPLSHNNKRRGDRYVPSASDYRSDAASPLATSNQVSKVKNRLVTTDFINAGSTSPRSVESGQYCLSLCFYRSQSGFCFACKTLSRAAEALSSCDFCLQVRMLLSLFMASEDETYLQVDKVWRIERFSECLRVAVCVSLSPLIQYVT